jgi:glucoamylase
LKFRGDRLAFGGPGIEPKWTQGNKEGVGTSPYTDSKVWFTIWRGVLTEVYYPLVDHPQIRDLQYLVTDGRTFFHEEKRHLESRVERPTAHGLAYRITTSDPAGRYRLEKEVISDPHLPVVLLHTRLVPGTTRTQDLSLFALLAPHLDVGGWGNNAYVVESDGRELLVAERNGTWVALGASRPFQQLSCGYVGASDGWTDLSENYLMDFEFDRATDGNVALTGLLDLDGNDAFTLGLAFGRGLSDAVTALRQSLSVPYARHREQYVDGWSRLSEHLSPLARRSHDGGNLYRASHSLLLAHEDKTFRGARIASLSIPWGQVKGDDDRGGYHLVWTRDLVQSAIGLLAAGDADHALQSLVYLAVSQLPEGNFPQNFWLSGQAYWAAVQLDEVAFPILLAGLLQRERALQEFDPWPMVRAGARFLIAFGPATEQERWEEVAGYSPSTLASNIAALVVAADFARAAGEPKTARFIEEYADYLNSHVDRWTVTTEGTLHPRIRRHYVRIRPANPMDSYLEGPANTGTVFIANHPPGVVAEYPVKEIVDAGFLELVRYGIRPPSDPLIMDSLEVADGVLRVDTPAGPCWRRYNHDGYGQRDDGGPFIHWGTGRAWPLLTAERAHYELARGVDPSALLEAVERFASPTGLLPEQVWDSGDRPDLHLWSGRPTTSAMPLVWAHAEYSKLLRSIEDGRVFDRLDPVEARYLRGHRSGRPMEIWKPHHRPAQVAAGSVLRIQAPEPFRLHWSDDGWATASDADAVPTCLGIHYVDLATESRSGRSLLFTFYWSSRSSWEGADFSVRIE